MNLLPKRRRLNPITLSLPDDASTSTSLPLLDFSFGFNNPKFSNVILNIMNYVAEEEKDGDGGDDGNSSCDSAAASSSRCKRKRKEESHQLVRLHVNSLVLSAHSDFFKSLFSNEMIESRALEVPVYVAEDEAQLLVDIIHFIYTNQFQTPKEDMLNLLFVADRYLFTKVAEDIIEHHKTALTLERCIEYLDLKGSFQATTYSKLLFYVKAFIVNEFCHFDDVWNTNKFKDLPASAVGVIFESDSLVVQSENTILCGLLAWATAEPATRLQEIQHFVKYLRFGQMDPSFLVDVVKKLPPITSHPDFECIYKKVQTYKSQKTQVVSPEPFMIPRIYIDGGSVKFTSDFRQISRLQEGHPLESTKFYWRGYYLYLTVQKIDNRIEIAINVDHQLAGLGQILSAGQQPPSFTNNPSSPDSTNDNNNTDSNNNTNDIDKKNFHLHNNDTFLSLKHESSLDLLNCYTHQYDRIVRHFTSYYGPNPSPVVLWHLPWSQFTSPQYPHVGNDDVLGVKLKVKLRSRGMCLLCGSLAYQLCGRCRGIYYCSKDCQKRHWIEHKKDCRAVEAFEL